MSLVPYGPPIRDAIAKGDLGRMKQLAAEARKLLKKQGNLPQALADLESAIAGLERPKKSRSSKSK